MTHAAVASQEFHFVTGQPLRQVLHSESPNFYGGLDAEVFAVHLKGRPWWEVALDQNILAVCYDTFMAAHVERLARMSRALEAGGRAMKQTVFGNKLNLVERFRRQGMRALSSFPSGGFDKNYSKIENPDPTSAFSRLLHSAVEALFFRTLAPADRPDTLIWALFSEATAAQQSSDAELIREALTRATFAEAGVHWPGDPDEDGPYRETWHDNGRYLERQWLTAPEGVREVNWACCYTLQNDHVLVPRNTEVARAYCGSLAQERAQDPHRTLTGNWETIALWYFYHRVGELKRVTRL